MADEKVSQLTEATSIGNNDYLYLIDDGVSKKVKYDTIVKDFTLKNVELGGLPSNWWDTSNPDGELYLYRYVEEDDGLVDPYFSVTKDGIEFDEYIANPDQGTVSIRIHHLRPGDFPKIHKLIDYDPDDCNLQYYTENHPKLKISGNDDNRQITIGTMGISGSDLDGNDAFNLNNDTLISLNRFGPSNMLDDPYEFNVDYDFTPSSLWDCKTYFTTSIQRAYQVYNTVNFGTMGIEWYRNDVPLGKASMEEICYLEGVTNYIQAQFDKILSSIATVETSTASRAYNVGDLFVFEGMLVKATQSIAQGGTITYGTNCTQTTILAELS